MKKCTLLLACFFSTAFFLQSYAQKHKLVKIWETDTTLKVPESVLFDGDNKVLYISNIDGTDPWGVDGKGSIGKVGLDGKIISVDWVKGLNAPKGLGRHGNWLYAADINKLVVIDISKGKIDRTITVSGSEGLNDVSVDAQGVVYVSDSKLKKVFRVENDQATLLLDKLKGPNGVLMRGHDLYLLDAGGVYLMEPDKSLTKIADGMEGGTDGIENVTGDDFIVSCWAGAVWYVHADGSKELLLDTRDAKRNSADIGYDPATKRVYVPTFWKNSVVAYEVK